MHTRISGYCEKNFQGPSYMFFIFPNDFCLIIKIMDFLLFSNIGYNTLIISEM